MTENPYLSCSQCPRKCGINRAKGEKGFCGETERVRVASACLHFGEEPLLTVFGGSGTIFFTGCSLGCSFCQNYQISRLGLGSEVGEKEFIEICLRLQSLGAENINLVTASHHIPSIARYIKLAKKEGLSLPIAWNSSAFESIELLEQLEGLVDIYLPDLKTLNTDVAKSLFLAQDYPGVAKKAIKWMIEKSPLKIEAINRGNETREKIMSGVIIRHLFLPGRIDDTIFVLEWLKENADKKALISLMSQYTPVSFSEEEKNTFGRSNFFFEDRLVNNEEDETLRDLIEAFDFDYLFYQDLSCDTSWLPDFNRSQPFSSTLAHPVWHWKENFLP